MADDDLYGDLDSSADALKIKGVSASGVYVPVSHNDKERQPLFLRLASRLLNLYALHAFLGFVTLTCACIACIF